MENLDQYQQASDLRDLYAERGDTEAPAAPIPTSHAILYPHASCSRVEVPVAIFGIPVAIAAFEICIKARQPSL